MARYTYNKDLVCETLEELENARNALKNTNADIQKGIDMISNARGFEIFDVDFNPILKYKTSVIEYIDIMKKEITSKAQEIEEYDRTPWIIKYFQTYVMTWSKLIEGFIEVNENIIDGHVAIVGFVGGLFSSDFADACGEFVETRWVRGTTEKWYEDGWLKYVNKYSFYSHTSTAANIFNTVGCVLGYVALSAIPYAGAIISTVGGIMGAVGTGTESGLIEGKTYNQAFGSGVIQGVIAAATVAITKGAISKLTSKAGALVNSVDDFGKAAVSAKSSLTGLKSVLANSSDEVLGLLDDMSTTVDDITGFTDDVIAKGTTTSASATEALKNAQKLTKTTEALKNTAKLAGYGDDVIKSIDDFANIANNAEKLAKNTSNIVKNTSPILNGKVGETGAKVADKTKRVITKVPGTNKIASTMNKVTTALSTSPAGQALTNITVKAMQTIPNASNAVATTAGLISSGTLKNDIVTSEYEKAIIESEKIAQQATLANKAHEGLQDASPSIGKDPLTVPDYEEQETNANNQTSTYNGNKSVQPNNKNISYTAPDNKHEVITESVELPQYKNENTATTNQSAPSRTETINKMDNVDDVIGSSNVVQNNVNKNNSSVTISALSNENDKITEVSDNILSSLGDASDTLTEITGEKGVYIPSASSPIINPSVKSNSSILPVGLGLGTAAITGLGTEKYLANRKKDNKKIDTEKWKEVEEKENNKFTIPEERDYLTAADEYAFQS